VTLSDAIEQRAAGGLAAGKKHVALAPKVPVVQNRQHEYQAFNITTPACRDGLAVDLLIL